MSTSPSNVAVLAEKDTNMTTAASGNVGVEGNAKDMNSMEYHRQVLASKMAAGQGREVDNYISPSDGIMSPASAKLTAYKSKQFGKGKPQSLFAKASSKNMAAKGGALFGDLKTASTAAPESN